MERVPRRWRAGPVSGSGLGALQNAAEPLAKGWLIAVIEDAPLTQAAAAADPEALARAPDLCRALVAALADDGALDALAKRAEAPDGVLGAGAGQVGWLASIAALEAVLRGALRDAIPASDAELLAAAGDRLAVVIEALRSAVARSEDGRRAGQPAREGRGRAQLPDEAGRAGAGDGLAWIAALEQEIGAARRTGTPLCLLLAELDDADRLTATGGPEEGLTLGRFSDAIRSAIGPGDTVGYDDGRRAWIVARDTSRTGGKALADRIVAAALGRGGWSGGPLAVDIGIAILDQDGGDSASLIDVAETRALEAAAGGRDLTGEPQPA